MAAEIGDGGIGLEVAGETDFDGDAAVGNIFAEIADIALAIGDRGIGDQFSGKEVVAVADAVGMEAGDGFEDAFWAVGFAGVDSFLEEVVVSEVEGVFVIVRWEAGFRASDVESDDGDAHFVAEFDHGLNKFEGGEVEDAFGFGEAVEFEEGVIIVGHAGEEGAHGARDDGVVAFRFVAGGDGGGAVEFGGGAGEAAVDGIHDGFDILMGIDVELRCEADFEVADAFVKVIPSEFVGDAFEGFRILHDGNGVGEALEVFFEAVVAVFEDEVIEAFVGLGGEWDAGVAGEFDEGGYAD